MTKEDSIRKVQEILYYLNLNPKQLAENLGYKSTTMFNNVLHPKKTNKLTIDMIDRLCKVYPNLSKDYLITGEGSLNKNGSNIRFLFQNIKSSNISKYHDDDPSFDNLLALFEEMSAQVTKAQEQIDNLISLLEKQE